MKWERLPLGVMQTNCYCVYEENKCLIFDPGDDGATLIQWLENKKLLPKAILLTHAHFDHIGAVDEVRDYFHVPVYIHTLEKEWLENPKYNGSILFFPNRPITARRADILLKDEGKIEVDSFSFQVFETPGHSPGSVSYYFPKDNFIISGDVLFYGSIGRTDLPGGDYDVLMSSIKNKLFPLPEETIVLPGHGVETKLSTEKIWNPFLKNLS